MNSRKSRVSICARTGWPCSVSRRQRRKRRWSSSVTSTDINLPLSRDPGGSKDLEMTLTRARFEEITADLVEKTMGPTRQALSDAGLPEQIDDIILVGGSTRIPAVQEAIRRLLGKEPHK